jgi:hypothetical protein
MSGTFVFVVCGTAEHINTLHFSLKALRRFSRCEIIVLTDSSRNELPISYENVIDIKAPEKFNHHQASIFLKTGAHKYLPKGRLYCYLDTDVVAINEQVDDIFKYKTEIINFSSDHCRVPKFSPHAVNCGCLEKNRQLRQELDDILLKYKWKLNLKDPVLIEKQRNLINKFDVLKKKKFRYFLVSLRFIFTPYKFKLDDDTCFLRWKNIWVDKKGNTILLGENRKLISRIEKNTSWKWNKKNEKWISPDGQDPDILVCNHLVELIYQKFKIDVEELNWQHWNGGVFLFDDSSHPFLESWHAKTLAIFEDADWKTRDQGTLIATAWEFGLQHVKTLPIEYNFLADYHHPTLKYHKNLTFSLKDINEQIKPVFLHIYHHWGNTEWDVWRDVVNHVGS